MRITKYLHSCLLIEEQGKTILFDPGDFTYEAGVFPIDSLINLDYILITHEHADHCHLPFIKDLVAKFPQVQIISNPSVVSLLKKEHLVAISEGNEFIKLIPVQHERVFDFEPPLNVQFEIFGKLAHPGDSITFTTDKEVLALPLMGPSWTITQAAEKALFIKPKTIIPIHDWHWKDSVRKAYYQRLKKYLKPRGIAFKGLETGETIEV